MAGFARWISSLRGGTPSAILAPMSGISDLGFRLAAQKFGTPVLVTEMVDGAGLAAGDAANRLKADGRGIDVHIVQIAGRDPARLAEAARVAEAGGADAIDINMGCPAKKVVGGLAGSALMREPDRAAALIRAVVGAVSVPVTLKMRLGWDDRSLNAADLARRAEGEGVALVTVHGRTRCQFYKGRADWRAIRAVVDAVSLPVVANGDCASLEDARAMLAQSGAAAVMVGRAALGRPWLVGEIAQALATGCRPATPSHRSRGEAARSHYLALIHRFGTDQGVRHARKHLAAYAAHAGCHPGSWRYAALLTATRPDDVVGHLAAIFGGSGIEGEAAA